VNQVDPADFEKHQRGATGCGGGARSCPQNNQGVRGGMSARGAPAGGTASCSAFQNLTHRDFRGDVAGSEKNRGSGHNENGPPTTGGNGVDGQKDPA